MKNVFQDTHTYTCQFEGMCAYLYRVDFVELDTFGVRLVMRPIDRQYSFFGLSLPCEIQKSIKQARGPQLLGRVLGFLSCCRAHFPNLCLLSRSLKRSRVRTTRIHIFISFGNNSNYDLHVFECVQKSSPFPMPTCMIDHITARADRHQTMRLRISFSIHN